MEKWQEDYIKTICNYFNNLCGYMEDSEVYELINIIFNNEDINFGGDFDYIKGLINSSIEVDNDRKLIDIFTLIKNNYIVKS